MATKWVVVAESSRARIFAFQQAGLAMEELEGLTHPASRAHERDLISDRPGRSFDSFGSGRHAMEEEVSLKQQEAIVFAREISDRLELARTRGEFDELTLVAAPAFLGLLRENLSAATHKLIVRTIDKNLVQRNEDPRSLRIRIREVGRDVIGPTLPRRGGCRTMVLDALVEVFASKYRAFSQPLSHHQGHVASQGAEPAVAPGAEQRPALLACSPRRVNGISLRSDVKIKGSESFATFFQDR